MQVPIAVPLPSPLMASVQTSAITGSNNNMQNIQGSDHIRTLDYDNGMLKSPSGRVLQQIIIEGLEGPPLYALVNTEPYRT